MAADFATMAGAKRKENNTGFLVFRQSCWMITATLIGSMCTVWVHGIAQKMQPRDYSEFFVLLRILFLLSIPGAALQMAFAREMAAVLSREGRDDVIACMRKTVEYIVFAWMTIGLVVLLNADVVCALVTLQRTRSLCLIIPIAAGTSIIPVLTGLLQGDRRFGVLGFVQVFDGLLRCIGMVLVVLVLRLGTEGAILAIGLCRVTSILICLWFTRGVWTNRSRSKDYSTGWLRDFGAASVAMVTSALMYSVDIIFINRVFQDDAAKTLYQGAALAGFAILQFLSPITSVLFPLMVRGKVRLETTNTFWYGGLFTVTLAILSATIYSFIPDLPLKLIYPKSPEMWHAAPLVPWIAWAYLPVVTGNLVMQRILAEKKYGALPCMVSVLGLYGAFLWLQTPTLINLPPLEAFTTIIKVFGIFNLLFLVVVGWFAISSDSKLIFSKRFAHG